MKNGADFLGGAQLVGASARRPARVRDMQVRRRDVPLPVAGQVTSLELFFDLVFVFTITQLTATVLPGGWARHRANGAAAPAAVVDVRRLRVADQRRSAGHAAAARRCWCWA